MSFFWSVALEGALARLPHAAVAVPPAERQVERAEALAQWRSGETNASRPSQRAFKVVCFLDNEAVQSATQSLLPMSFAESISLVSTNDF